MQPKSQPVPMALYVHIPFCETKCPYCDFNTYAGIESLMPAYVGALRTEIADWGAVLDHPPLTTVFFGGGTPSYLPSRDIQEVLSSISASFDTANLTEMTLESNPGDLGPEKMAAFVAAGVNRLSIGVQSFSDRLLGLLGRRHNAAEAVSAYRNAMAAGFSSVSIDLMYGLPHQSLQDWEQTLSATADLEPPHISMYALTLEGGTPMERLVAEGKLPEQDGDLAADMYLAAEERFGAFGYRHYEISNWAMPGHESAHNLTYWRNGPFLGVGPGAHSYLEGQRFSNLKSPREYVARLDGAPRPGRADGPLDPRTVEVVEHVERIDRRLEMAETMMMGLRLDTGIGVDAFTKRFGASPAEEFNGKLDDLQGAGLLEVTGSALRLTPRGRLLGNEVFSRFFE